eukprot:gene9219-8296_t
MLAGPALATGLLGLFLSCGPRAASATCVNDDSTADMYGDTC